MRASLLPLLHASCFLFCCSIVPTKQAGAPLVLIAYRCIKSNGEIYFDVAALREIPGNNSALLEFQRICRWTKSWGCGQDIFRKFSYCFFFFEQGCRTGAGDYCYFIHWYYRVINCLAACYHFVTLYYPIIVCSPCSLLTAGITFMPFMGRIFTRKHVLRCEKQDIYQEAGSIHRHSNLPGLDQ